MIEPTDKEITWNKIAKENMTLETMFQLLHNPNDDGIFISFYEPTNKSMRQSDYQGDWDIRYQTLYENHSIILNSIVKIFNGNDDKFYPPNITIEGTNEYYMMFVINAVAEITWFHRIDDRKRNYEKLEKKLYEFYLFFNQYGNNKEYKFSDLMNYPDRPNDIINQLNDRAKNTNRKAQFEKALNAVKKHFSIEKLTPSKRSKINKLNRESIVLKPKYLHTNEKGETTKKLFQELPKEGQDKMRHEEHKRVFKSSAKDEDTFKADGIEKEKVSNLDKELNLLMVTIHNKIIQTKNSQDKQKLKTKLHLFINTFTTN